MIKKNRKKITSTLFLLMLVFTLLLVFVPTCSAGTGSQTYTPNEDADLSAWGVNQDWNRSGGSTDYGAINSVGGEYFYYDITDHPGSVAIGGYNLPNHTTEPGRILNITYYAYCKTTGGSGTGAGFYLLNETFDDAIGNDGYGTDPLPNNFTNGDWEYLTCSFPQYGGLLKTARDWSWGDIDTLQVTWWASDGISGGGTHYVDHVYIVVYYETSDGGEEVPAEEGGITDVLLGMLPILIGLVFLSIIMGMLFTGTLTVEVLVSLLVTAIFVFIIIMVTTELI